MSAPQLVLDVRRLSVDYGYRAPEKIHRAVQDVSFGVSAGEGVAIMGESGSGKSTLALAILGLLPGNARVRAGSISFRDRDILRMRDSELERIRGREIAMIFQEPAMALNPVLRVGNQVAEVVRAHNDCSWKHCRETATAMLRDVRLPDPERLYDAYPHQLSSGQQQRVAIAQALVCRPALVIADEPTSSLDVTTQAEVLALMKELKERLNLAILMITHDPAILTGLADRVVVLHAGEVVETGSLSQVCDRPMHSFTQSLLSPISPIPPAW